MINFGTLSGYSAATAAAAAVVDVVVVCWASNCVIRRFTRLRFRGGGE